MASNQGLARLGFLADESQWGNQTRLSQDAQGRQVFLGHRGCPEELRLSQEDRYNTIATGWPRHDTCTAINNHVSTVNAPPDIGLDATISRGFLGRPAKFWARHNLNPVTSPAPTARHRQNFLRAHIALFHRHSARQISVPELGNR